MNNQNWDDIRFVLAVAKHGSLNAAASALGVTHATVMRRVAAFEARYCRPVFHKSLAGYRALPEARDILLAAENIQEAVLAAERVIAGADRSPAGQVRIASTDSLCQFVLPQVAARIAENFPKIDLKFLSANVHHDLTRLTADIVIRPSAAIAEGMVGECAGHIGFAVYGDGSPDRNWLGLEGALEKSLAAKWMSENVSETEIVGGADSFLVLAQMAASGVGKALLPRFVARHDARLQPITTEGTDFIVPVWVATLAEFAQTPRFALVQKLLIEELAVLLDPDPDIS